MPADRSTAKGASSPRHVLAIDQGTTSSRALVFDERLGVVAIAQKEFAQHFPASGWVEHEPEDIWSTTLAVCRQALRKAGLNAADIAAIGITNQRETTVGVGSRHRPGHPPGHRLAGSTDGACLRSAAQGRHESLISSRTGLVLDPYFSATKIAWILDNVPGARARARKGELAFGTVDSFLLWRLTGGAVHATDATNASRTMLLDIHKGKWDKELCKLLRVPVQVLPDVRDCAADFGMTETRPCSERRFPHSRHRWRPAGGDDRAGLLRARHDEIHLRHRLLRAAEHRGAGRPIEKSGFSPPSPTSSMASAPMRWRGRSSSRARPCNGCGTG